MEVKISKHNLIIIFLAVGVFIIGAVILTNRQEPPISKKTSTENPDITTGTTDVKTSGFYDEKTRVITSPIITRVVDNTRYKFSFNVPNGWEVQRAEQIGDYHISIEIVKKDHILEINTEVAGSSTCVYPGEEKDPPHYEIFDRYDPVATEFGTVRISRVEVSENYPSVVRFSGCQTEVTPRWNTYTNIGYINYRVPVEYEESIIQEMNEILQNIEYKEL